MDDYIASTLSDMLSGSCLRKFTFLETYFCYACSESEPLNTDLVNMEIRVCRSFLKELWGETLDVEEVEDQEVLTPS